MNEDKDKFIQARGGVIAMETVLNTKDKHLVNQTRLVEIQVPRHGVSRDTDLWKTFE